MSLLIGGIIVWVVYAVIKRFAAPPKRPLAAVPAAGANRSNENRLDRPTTREGKALPIDLSEDFRRALAAINARDCHVFVTGRAGTGKSTLLRHIAETTQRRFAIVAPTGLAAINVGGQTIHSFFKLPPGFVEPKEKRSRRDAQVLKALDLLVIDEVSMVRADLMDGIDTTLRTNRRDNRPFGGVQVVMFGDPWQLSPIVSEGGAEGLL